MTDPTPVPPPAPALLPDSVPTRHQIRTDRPCAGCGFNLFGQPIVREPHYGLIAARCPECGRLAALQEYPALGRWADRWAKLLATLWVLFLLVMASAHFGPMLGFSFSLLESASEDLGSTIGSRYTESLQASQQGPPNPQQAYMGAGSWTSVDTGWWRDNRDEIMTAYRTSPRRAARSVAYLWFFLGLGAVMNGVFWSVCLLGTRRRAAVLIALLPLGLAVSIVWASGPTIGWGGPNTILARDAAREILKPSIMPLILATTLLATALGVWQGRRIARGVVRLSLPPRMRSALGILWTRDGLAPPSAGPR